MIFIDRNQLIEPPVLSDRGEKELEKARQVFETSGRKGGYARFQFRLHRHPDVRKTLVQLFNGKCAYCESRVDEKMGSDVEHFRPKKGCIDDKGTLFPHHYWWLALSWSNLYLACVACNRAKKNRFPILGERASVDDMETLVERLYQIEQPLLLDPCRRDDEPEAHFVYSSDGRINSDTERGRVTIETCALNRRSLVAARLDRLKQVEAIMSTSRTAIDNASDEERPELIRQLIEVVKTSTTDDSPYAGMCRQLTRHFLDEMGLWADELDQELTRQVGSSRFVSDDERKKVFDDYSAFKQSKVSYSLDEDEAGDYYEKSHTIQKIVIRNFRPIEDLTLEVNGDEEVPWMMLLGENGCGKSSAIRAIALTLMGEKARSDPSLALDASEYLRRGEDSGAVEVYLSGLEEPLILELKKDDPTFYGDTALKVLLLAYGSTRLLPRHTDDEVVISPARVSNLFNPFTPLLDASAWLLQQSPAEFEELKPALKQLLNLGEGDDLHQNHDENLVEVTLHGDTVVLEHLSDGYQCVVALAVEIMAVMKERWTDISVAEGIVLLDEVGSHLHPSWKMKIVSSLRDTFPSVQFIVSSHDPLCLRGMKDREVWVMDRTEDGKVIASNELPNHETMRVDQILQSEFFDLDDTVDEETNELFRKYYDLLRNRDRDAMQEDELDTLRQKLKAMGALGENERERMMLDAIDEYRADRTLEVSAEGRKALKDGTRARLKEIWSSAMEKKLTIQTDSESSS